MLQGTANNAFVNLAGTWPIGYPNFSYFKICPELGQLCYKEFIFSIIMALGHHCAIFWLRIAESYQPVWVNKTLNFIKLPKFKEREDLSTNLKTFKSDMNLASLDISNSSILKLNIWIFEHFESFFVS